MIKGVKKLDLQVEDILRATDGGYDIYRAYLGKVNRVMPRPWGRKETKNSWGIFPNPQGIWMWKDHGNESSGNAIQFVEKYFSVTFVKALDKIAWDFGLSKEEVNISPIKVNWEKPDIERDYIDIKFSSKPFDKRHHEFWNSAEVTEVHCNSKECWAVKDAAINKKKIWIGKDEIVFAYYCKEEDGVKLYFPDRDKAKRFRNNVSYHYLWNYENVQQCNNLIVQKSFKDMLVTTLLNPCCIATQAEAVKIFDDDTVKKINDISNCPWIWYGADQDGVDKCTIITNTQGWRYVNTPKELLPDINDTYGYVKRFGLRQLELFMKEKGLL